mmetsp:Transcript_32871/g.43659  ORF Transcript_32871/g.43659 Transcript_32871/m.43659 type:complete len:353 (-) Transcript_32871:177-1235(-)
MKQRQSRKQLGVIVIGGLGQISKNQHIPVIAEHRDEITLIAVVDTAETALHCEHPSYSSVPQYKSLDHAMRRHSNIDIAVIACPPQFSQCYAEEALRMNLHVLMEKPPGLYRKGLEALADVARSQNLTLFTGYHSAFCPCMNDMKRWVEENSISDVNIEWKESAAKWHPGQTWIKEETGLGVMDCLFNPFSILDELGIFTDEKCNGCSAVELVNSKLYVPRNWKSPIAGSSTFLFRDDSGGVSQKRQIIADYAWNYEGSDDLWNISLTSEDGQTLELVDGGSRLCVNGRMLDYRRKDKTGTTDKLRLEYEALYHRFLDIVSKKECYVRTMPLRVINDILEQSEVQIIDPYAL